MVEKESLIQRTKKNSTIKGTDILSETKFFSDREKVWMDIPMLNVASAGTLDGGFTSGVHIIAGESKHFKTGLGLIFMSNFLKQYPEGIALVYDNEFGAPPSFYEFMDVDMTRVIHTPIEDIEMLKHDIAVQLNSFSKKDKVFIFIDSLGNIASRKETEDALEGKVVVDMTRAKAMKSLFRIITAKIKIKDIPFFAVSHTYQELKLYGGTVVSGGTGQTYSADEIWIVRREAEKDSTKKKLLGFKFTLYVEKSRTIHEQSRIPLFVSFEHGINTWSGLLEVALEGNYIKKHQTKPITYWVDNEDEHFKVSEIDTHEFWTNIFQNTTFPQFVADKYLLTKTISENPVVPSKTSSYEVNKVEVHGSTLETESEDVEDGE